MDVNARVAEEYRSFFARTDLPTENRLIGLIVYILSVGYDLYFRAKASKTGLFQTIIGIADSRTEGRSVAVRNLRDEAGVASQRIACLKNAILFSIQFFIFFFYY